MSSKLILESISQKVVGLEDEYRTAMFLYFRYAVLLSRPSKDGFARLDGRLGKIARLTPVFLKFCPSFYDLVQVQSVSEMLSKVNYVATRLRHLETIR